MKLFAVWLVSSIPAAGFIAHLFAQATGGSGSGSTDLNWPTILVSYGVASPLVIYIIMDNRRKDSRIVQVEARNQTLTDAAIDKIVPLQAQTIDVLRDARQELKDAAAEREKALVTIHQLSGRVDPLTLTRIHHQLARLEAGEK